MKTHTLIEKELPLSLADADFKPRGRVFKSPGSWRDQVFYQIIPDRFSDAQEKNRPLFDFDHPEKYQAPDKRAWMSAGNRFNGGTLKGIESKLEYLQTLGVNWSTCRPSA